MTIMRVHAATMFDREDVVAGVALAESANFFSTTTSLSNLTTHSLTDLKPSTSLFGLCPMSGTSEWTREKNLSAKDSVERKLTLHKVFGNPLEKRPTTEECGFLILMASTALPSHPRGRWRDYRPA